MTAFSRLTRFDLIVIAAIAVLIAGISVTILLGDRVGVTLERVTPLGMARSTNRITLQFSETMNRDTVTERLRFEPELPGTVSWNADTLIFTPEEAMPPGTDYTVTLEAGAQSDSGREVLSEYQFSFTVRTPRIAYLFPADDFPQNVWIVDPLVPDSAEQITFSPTGVYDFAISPDGSSIAFAENNPDGTNDIKLLNFETGALTQLTNCPDSACTTPTWRPDGNTIAYERIDFNSDLAGQVGNSPTRVWILDLTVTPPTTRPLFSELQILGFNAQWSADGSRIAVFDASAGTILVYDFNDSTLIGIPSRAGSSGALSPDGRRLVFPETAIIEGSGARTYLRVADLDSSEVIYLSTPDDGTDDRRAQWRPDGEILAVSRRNEAEIRGTQLYLVDPVTGAAERLTNDPRYANDFFWWDPTGTQLVIQRFPELDENMQPNNLGRPEIWTLNTETGEMIQAAVNGFVPRWVP